MNSTIARVCYVLLMALVCHGQNKFEYEDKESYEELMNPKENQPEHNFPEIRAHHLALNSARVYEDEDRQSEHQVLNYPMDETNYNLHHRPESFSFVPPTQQQDQHVEDQYRNEQHQPLEYIHHEPAKSYQNFNLHVGPQEVIKIPLAPHRRGYRLEVYKTHHNDQSYGQHYTDSLINHGK